MQHASQPCTVLITRRELGRLAALHLGSGAISGIALHGLGRVAITLLNVPRSRAL